VIKPGWRCQPSFCSPGFRSATDEQIKRREALRWWSRQLVASCLSDHATRGKQCELLWPMTTGPLVLTHPDNRSGLSGPPWEFGGKSEKCKVANEKLSG